MTRKRKRKRKKLKALPAVVVNEGGMGHSVSGSRMPTTLPLHNTPRHHISFYNKEVLSVIIEEYFFNYCL